MKIIVIDDDPTGSQLVHDCLLLLNWNYETLLKGLLSKSSLLFVLANTRSLSEKEVKKRLQEICNNLHKVSIENNIQHNLLFVSRGDSTLRGHNFLEPYLINEYLGPFDATFHIPAFLEGNRITLNGKHFVNDIPAHKTTFAKDIIFGYDTNDLKKLLHQKSRSKIELKNIENLNCIDQKSSYELKKYMENLKNNTHVIVDIDKFSQLEKFSKIIRELIKNKKFLFRTAASFLKAISSTKNPNKSNFYYSQLRVRNNLNQFLPGLIIIGSYTDISTNQFKNLLEFDFFNAIEIDVEKFYEILFSKDKETQIYQLKNFILEKISITLKNSCIPIIYTSRKEKILANNLDQMDFYNSLSSFVAEIVADIKHKIGYLISKGGITSNTILNSSFDVDYVYLEGQICSGISLVKVKLIHNNYLPVITFPGNLGDDYSLKDVWNIIENK